MDPFGEISFLTRSENRITVLETLAGGRYTEQELTDETGISDVTVKRAIDAFRQRGWIRETETGYTTTPVGELLAADYRRLAGTMDVACHVGPVVDLLPVDEMDFDLRLLSEARISDPDDVDVLEIVDRWITLIREADRLEVFAYRTGRIVAEPIYEGIEAGTLELEAVVPPSELEQIRSDPTTREFKQKIIDAGGNYYLAPEDQPKPYSVGMFDDLAAIAGWGSDSKPQVHLESRADPIVEWTRSRYERAKADAEPLTAEDLEP
ncbi:hypothetical protein H5V44_01130 [Halobellus sp. MBLA0160]|uniref:Uncharacterized protein n=1 Tax=Halobellus ruber TaxID=2761102 RepID=A0A7J9SFZ1_9EURY|nr:hypothetical protein [Halobellus ruber]